MRDLPLLYFILRSSYFIQHQDVECNGSVVNRMNAKDIEDVFCAIGVFFANGAHNKSHVISISVAGDGYSIWEMGWLMGCVVLRD